MSATLTLALDAGDHLGESPTWRVEDQSLWWINCEHPAEIRRWSPVSGEQDRWEMPRRIGGFAHKASGGMLVALADGLYDFDTATQTLSLRVASPLPAHIKLHECLCDRQGRFWIGAYDHNYPADRGAAGGAFFRLDGDRLTPMIEAVAVGNGLAFSPDGRTLYATSSSWGRIDAFDVDAETGDLANRRTFVTLEPGAGIADGATVDADGGYWLALVGTGRLRRYRPDGTLDLDLRTPCSNPTKPAFGGPDLATLFVTSTQMRIMPQTSGGEQNGGLFAFEPGRKGVPDTDFRDR